jgi:hypothetical protein
MKKNIGQIIDNRYKFSRDQQSDIFDDFARYKALWLSKIVDTGGWPWDYTLFNPMVFSTLRSFVARTSTGNPGITLQAWNEEDRPKTKLNTDLLLWELQEAEFQQKLARAVFSCGLYGKAFLWDGWLFEKEKYVQEEDDQGNDGRKILMKPKVNRADLGNVRSFDVYVANRNLPDVQSQPWIIIRRWRTVAELKRLNEMRGGEVYHDLDKLKDKNLFVRYVDYGRDVMYQDNADIPFENGVLEVLEMWDMEEGKVYEKIKNSQENKLVIREENNPYYHDEYPLIDLTFFPEEDEFWTQGLVRPMEDLQMALNAVLNQYLTNARQQLNNMWITGDVRIPDWEFISRPNGVIHTQGNIDQIKEVQHKDITQQAMTMMGELRNDIQRTTGINDYLAQGTPDKGKGRSGAAAMQMEESNLDQNLKLFMTFLEQQTIKKIAKHFLANNKQFITSDQTIRIAGRHGYRHVNVKEEQVSAGFDPIVIPNSMLPKNPMIRVQNLENLKAMADNEQKININTAPIWKEMVSTMGLTDLDEIVPDDKDEAMEENDMMEKGIDVEVEVNDNHDAHITVHQFALIKDKLDKAASKRFIQHIEEHKLWKVAQDPDMIEKMMGKQQAPAQQSGVPNPANGIAAASEQASSPSPVQPAATSVQGLVQQQGQQMGQAMQPPSGVPIPNPASGLQG